MNDRDILKVNNGSKSKQTKFYAMVNMRENNYKDKIHSKMREDPL